MHPNGEKMNKQRKNRFNQWGSTALLAASGVLKTFLGWTKRFGNKEAFLFPSRHC